MPTTQELIAERKAALEKERLRNLQKDVEVARHVLRQRLNAYVDEEHTPSTLLDKPTFRIEFPEADRAIATKVFYGNDMEVTETTLRLCWVKSSFGVGQYFLYWKGDFTVRKELLGKHNEIELFVGRAMGRP